MPSKVIAPSNPEIATPIVWRLAQPLSSPPPTPPPDPEPDLAAKIAQLEQQWQVRVREAHAAGLRDGEAAGHRRGTAEIQPAIERMSRAIAELAELRPRLRKEAEADTIRLALAIARRILHRELAVDPEALRGLLLAALERLQSNEISRVRVHPSHAAIVTACLQKAATVSTIDVIADPSRDPGDIIFETHRGNLDASINSQLEEIQRGLTDLVGQASRPVPATGGARP